MRILIAALLVTSAACNLYLGEDEPCCDDDDIVDVPADAMRAEDATPLTACTATLDGVCGECFVQAPPLEVSTFCQLDVCAEDPSCCANDWDESCVRLADEHCGPCVDGVAFGGDGDFTAAWHEAGAAGYSSFTRAITDGTVSVAWADFDHDGDADVAATGNCSVRVLRNEGWAGGSLQFTQVFSLAPGGCTPAFGGRRALWADLDHDHTLDAVFVGASGVRWARGIQGAVIDGGVIVPPSVGAPSAVAVVDLDFDTRLDLVVGFADAPARIYRQTMPRTFTIESTWQGQVDGVRAAVECRLGGSEAIALAGDTGVEVYTVGVNGGLSAMTIPSLGTAIDLACGAQGDGDVLALLRGDDSVAIADTSGVVWSSTSLDPPRSFDGDGIAAGDTNGDGLLDLVIAPAAAAAPFTILQGTFPSGYTPVDGIDPAPAVASHGAVLLHLGREIKL